MESHRTCSKPPTSNCLFGQEIMFRLGFCGYHPNVGLPVSCNLSLHPTILGCLRREKSGNIRNQAWKSVAKRRRTRFHKWHQFLPKKLVGMCTISWNRLSHKPSAINISKHWIQAIIAPVPKNARPKMLDAKPTSDQSILLRPGTMTWIYGWFRWVTTSLSFPMKPDGFWRFLTCY